MSRHVLTEDERADRLDARRVIIAAANGHQRAIGLRAKPYTMRHIQRAVHVVRQAGAGHGPTLAAAGFAAPSVLPRQRKDAK